MSKKLFSGRAAVRILWELARLGWLLAAVAFSANLLAAILEGSTIGLLAIALELLGSPSSGPLGSSLGRLAEWTQRCLPLINREHLFLTLVLLAVIAQILKSGFQFIGTTATAHLEARVHAETHSRIFARILHLPFSKVSSYRLGDLTDYLNQSGYLSNVFLQLNLLVRNVLMVASYGILLLWLSWPMTLIALVAYGVISQFLRGIIVVVGRHAAHFTASSLTLNQRTTEFLQAIRLLHTFHRQEEAIREVDSLMKEGIRGRQRASVWGGVVEPIMEILTVVGVVAFLMGGYLTLGPQGKGGLGHLLALLVALYRMTPRLGAIHSSLVALAGRIPNVARIVEILQEEVVPVRNRRHFPVLREAVVFSNVTFHYQPDELPAVKNLCFSIPRGNMIALVGVSGAGKSTVADLLLRLYDPTSGQILIDGIDLKAFHLGSWRQKLGVVSQETFLFHTTIRENIAFGRPNVSTEEVVAVAKAAHAHEFITQLVDGYETVVGDRGYRLSGGQRQRIALARALVRRPEILILDEATSSLDSESERLIQCAMDEQRGQRIVLAIAHRLSTVIRADQIVVLDKGQLVERGTHQELLNLGAVYAHLWQLQSEGRLQGHPPVLELRSP